MVRQRERHTSASPWMHPPRVMSRPAAPRDRDKRASRPFLGVLVYACTGHAGRVALTAAMLTRRRRDGDRRYAIFELG
jgi:hypothetical protein